jgi:hypothetical protein
MGQPSPESESEQDVELYTSPWVSGTRAAAYFGPISSELFLPDAEVTDRSAAWTKAERELLESLRDKARMLGANAVVGLEVTLDSALPTQRRWPAPPRRGNRGQARTPVLTGPGPTGPPTRGAGRQVARDRVQAGRRESETARSPAPRGL